MAEEKNTKRKKYATWFVQINTQTFQGRITIPFLAVLLIGGMLFFVANSLWQRGDAARNKVIQIITPIQNETNHLIALLKRNEAIFYEFLFTKELIKKEFVREMWLVEIQQQKNTLKSAFYKEGSEEGKLLFASIQKQMADLSQAQEKVIQLVTTEQSEKTITYQINSDLKLFTEELDKTLKKAISFSQIKGQKILDTANTEKGQFNLIMIFGVIFWVVGSYMIGILMFTKIFKWIRDIRNQTKEMAYGNLPQPLPEKKFNNEFKGIVKDLNLLLTNFIYLKQYAEAVGRGEFDMGSKIFGSQSVLGRSLNEMSHSLENVTEKEYIRNWTAEGLAKFAQIQQKHTQDINGLCREMISELVKHMEATQGGFFLVNRENPEQLTLDLIGSYAFGKYKFLSKTLDVKEGLLGRAYIERKSVYLKEIPDNYIELVSGLGNTKPKTLIITPLINDDGIVQGILELASMRELEEYEIKFLEVLASSTASFITVVLAGVKNRQLLEESQKITQSLRVKEEESRLNAIELSKAREEIDQKLKETKREYEKLNGVLSHIPEGVIIMDADGQIEVFNKAAVRMFGYPSENIIGRNIRLILPNDYLTDEELNDDRENARLRIGIERNLKAIKKDGSQFNVEVSFSLVEINQEKLITAIVREA